MEWIENKYGEGTVRELNERMRDSVYEEKIFKELTGREVGQLWAMYKNSLGI